MLRRVASTLPSSLFRRSSPSSSSSSLRRAALAIAPGAPSASPSASAPSASASSSHRLTTLLAVTAAVCLFSTCAVSTAFAASHPPTSDSIMSANRKLIDEFVASNTVAIFSKSYCPYCKRVKALFDSIGVKYTAIELDTHPDGSGIQSELINVTGQRTVPNVFVRGTHIGGSDDTHAAQKSGRLQKLLDA
ncbi:glutaredoxin-C3 [Capsaspora owczarzaki ATCC 30864]|uniref:Glutaredoxin-C3 n=1 Tax=Capsaspora owczarzaki (strain ATCC 30864) TaxID=595528 RepID=A0A0D2VZD6_CAPO3|nr:glutaredoxin-C3 [Capsaspora owczarzaki ATCC 30864]KJE97197.1 glutaredoxin-C3 [Capsaspora owczarzaki ATCC 30864]|eukprot:XP_004343517.1 glutaredoxin-C3 [Capsaspora owczarzaki ATCC 30864]